MKNTNVSSEIEKLTLSIQNQKALVNKANNKEQLLENAFIGMCIVFSLEIVSLFWNVSTPALIIFALQVPFIFTLRHYLIEARNRTSFEKFVMMLVKDVQTSMYDAKFIPGYITVNK